MLRIWASDTQRCLLKKGIAMEFPHEKSGGVRVTTRWVLGWFLGPLNMYILEVGLGQTELFPVGVSKVVCGAAIPMKPGHILSTN